MGGVILRHRPRNRQPRGRTRQAAAAPLLPASARSSELHRRTGSQPVCTPLSVGCAVRRPAFSTPCFRHSQARLRQLRIPPYFYELRPGLPFAIYVAVLSKTYRRHLPHILPAGVTIFLTWRLRGSLPPGFVFDSRDQRDLSDGVSFAKMDKLLDRATHGPRWLADSAIAEEVCRAIERGAEAPLLQYVLHEFVVMPNHVHVLISPKTDVARITQGIKGSSARFANLKLGRVGESFWQDETFDRFCRSAEEFQQIRGYIARNPVRAGLAREMDEWPWSSWHRRSASASGARPAENTTAKTTV